MEKISQVAYRLKLLEGNKVHSIYHVLLQKKSIPARVKSQLLPPFSVEDWKLKVKLVVASRPGKTNTNGEKQVLIKWENLPDFENSWENLSRVGRGDC